MDFPIPDMAAQDRYKIMTATIVPRPIAWVTSCSGDGILNAAPYSFFNMMGHDPATVALGVLPGPNGLKDTAANICETGEFCVNLVSEDMAEAMNLTCIDAPPEVDELALAGLQTTPCHSIDGVRIDGTYAAFECRLLTEVDTGPRQKILIGEVVFAYVADDFIVDPRRCHLDTPRMGAIGRMHGAGTYARTTDLFDMTRPTWADRAEDTDKG